MYKGIRDLLKKSIETTAYRFFVKTDSCYLTIPSLLADSQNDSVSTDVELQFNSLECLINPFYFFPCKLNN